MITKNELRICANQDCENTFYPKYREQKFCRNFCAITAITRTEFSKWWKLLPGQAWPDDLWYEDIDQIPEEDNVVMPTLATAISRHKTYVRY